MDSRSFFFEVAPGAQSAVSGFITLLAAAHALRDVTQQAPPNRTILYAFFQGVGYVHTVFTVVFAAVLLPWLNVWTVWLQETFDYIGSSRMVYDMQNNQFAVDLNNIHSFLEIGQVCIID